MKTKKITVPYPKSFIYLSLLFLIISLIQASLTELANDEAYYWRFAQYLDWGYFDHPPFTALMIKAGSTIFGGELGVRIICVLFGFASVYLLWHLIDKNDRNKPFAVSIFFMLWFALPIFNIYTFITVPDSPLLFFALLYIYFLRKFKVNSNVKNTLLLAVIMALMLYSKYHGVILILITVIADIKLLRNKNFYFASIFGAILFLPHLLWQYNHDFPTIRYHFFERNSQFTFRFITEYPLNVLLVLNPLLVIFFIIKNFKSKIKNKNETDKTLRFIFWGFIIFFGFSALKSHVEPHWVAVSSIPLLVLLFKLAVNDEKIQKTVKIFSVISIVILTAGRLFLMIDTLPIKTEFHGNKEIVKTIEEKADNIPVVFMSNYSKAAKYTFYTGKTAYSRTNIHFRKSQYTLWDFEKAFYNKPVLYISNYSFGYIKDRIALGKYDTSFYHFFKAYVPIQKMKVFTVKPKRILELNNNDSVKLKLYNGYDFDIRTDIPKMEIGISAIVFLPELKKETFPTQTELPKILPANDTTDIIVKYKITDVLPGNYEFGFAVKNGILFPKKTDEKFEITIMSEKSNENNKQ